MNLNREEDRVAVQRLTALWALNESGLGGLLHLFNSPFTGLFVGGFAIILISLIGYFSGDNIKKNILQALLIVLIVKAVVSPHSQPTAYLAVTFQALVGILFLSSKFWGVASWYMFGIVGLIESAMQKLILLFVLYGYSLIDSVNLFGDWLMNKWGLSISWSSTQLLIFIYLSIHIIGGILIGYFIHKLTKSFEISWNNSSYQLSISDQDKISSERYNGKSNYIWYLLAGLFMVAIFVGLVMPNENAAWVATKTLLRAMIIIGIWFLFLGPFIVKWINRFLLKKKSQLHQEVAGVFDLLPYLRFILYKSWRESSSLPFWRRWKTFITSTIFYSLKFRISNDDISS